jgi:hypothetical protein
MIHDSQKHMEILNFLRLKLQDNRQAALRKVQRRT